MRSYLFYSLLLVGTFFIFYLSWLSDPNLGNTNFLPKWLTDWTDAQKNDTIRTGVPFLILGLVTGFRGIYLQANTRWWLCVFALLTLVVTIAELGQILLPFRYSNVMDIFWGMIGSAIGLMPAYLFISLKNRNKR